MSLPDKVYDFLSAESLIPNNCRTILCGVSGGADSVALLTVMLELSGRLGTEIAAVHINHCLRGEESDRDERFVEELCRRLNVRLLSRRFDVLAISGGTGIEETARFVRYSYFDECAAHCESPVIATAHNANDNLETFLLRLARGTGLSGLASIPPMRLSEKGIAIIRPLLTVTREEIEEYLSKISVSYITDSSNLSDDYARNRLRHHVIPELERINERAVDSSIRTISLLRQDSRYLDDVSKAEVNLSAEKLRSLPYPIASRMIRSLYSSISRGETLTYEQVRSCLNIADSSRGSAECALPGRLRFIRRYDVITIEPEQSSAPEIEDTPIYEGETIALSLSCTVKCTIEDISPTKKRTYCCKSLNTFYLDYLKINGILCVGNRKMGDYIRLSESSGGKTLKKFMIDRKIPKEARDKIPVFRDKSGVVAVAGIGIDIRCKPDSNTTRLMKIEIEYMPGGQEK
ncbi:MAG: tRNA lysidine(34) synthetase TilS [Clostridiales bacterium]|jgi:tRNA(Ile)-lysidine synthase|nr:tRNA lysidine(34) synthetase TilS [Clostridiales bacterium]